MIKNYIPNEEAENLKIKNTNEHFSSLIQLYFLFLRVF